MLCSMHAASLLMSCWRACSQRTESKINEWKQRCVPIVLPVAHCSSPGDHAQYAEGLVWHHRARKMHAAGDIDDKELHSLLEPSPAEEGALALLPLLPGCVPACLAACMRLMGLPELAAETVLGDWGPAFRIAQRAKRLQREVAQTLPLAKKADLPSAWEVFKVLDSVDGTVERARPLLGVDPGGEQPASSMSTCSSTCTCMKGICQQQTCGCATAQAPRLRSWQPPMLSARRQMRGSTPSRILMPRPYTAAAATTTTMTMTTSCPHRQAGLP